MKFHNLEIVYSTESKKLKSELERLVEELNETNKKFKKELKNTLLLCKYCKKASVISECTYIQTHFYIRPYSCSGGDYWEAGESNWYCPECGSCHRFSDTKDKYEYENTMYFKELTSLIGYFKEIYDQYDKEMVLRKKS